MRLFLLHHISPAKTGVSIISHHRDSKPLLQQRVDNATIHWLNRHSLDASPSPPEMDIDDILAEVSLPSVDNATLDLQALTRAWVNEKCAPEVLPWPGPLVERVLGRVRRQVSLFCLFF